jgi:Leucine-rich repeat (LRR) protein
MNNLKFLSLVYNRLEHLDSDVISGLVNLERIYLEGNKLKYLRPDTFWGLPNIQHAILGKNPGLQILTDRNFINSHSLS